MGLRDPVSSATHLATAVWAAYATLIMCRLAGRGRARQAAVAIYGLSMVFLYTASGLYHGLHYDSPVERRFFQHLDHSAIYTLIAGTCTPAIVILLRGRERRFFLGLIWVPAALAAAGLWVFPRMPYAVTVGLCFCIGWMSIAPIVHYYRLLGWRPMNLVWLGAGCYTIGTACEVFEWPNPWRPWVGFHEVFHLCDMAGSAVLFVFIVRHVIPYRPAVALVPIPVRTAA